MPEKVSMGNGERHIVIKRTLSSAPVGISVECPAGVITVLSDREGTTAAEYEKALRGRATEDRFTLQWGGEILHPPTLCAVGFDDILPQDYGAKEFLSRSGISPAEVDTCIETYELKKYFYLSCSQLPASEARKLLLLRALQQKQTPLVLNDPFALFTGRWREHFAGIFLEHAVQEAIPVIVLNLGFYPQLWMNTPTIKKIDLGELTQKELERLIQLETEQKKAQKKEEQKAAPPPPPKIPAAVPPAQQKLSPEELKNLTYAYKGVHDWIFEPLARASSFARSWSGALAIVCTAFLVAVMGVVMFPEFREGHGKMSELIKKLGGIQWSPPASETALSLSPEQEVPREQPEEPVHIPPIDEVASNYEQEGLPEMAEEELLPVSADAPSEFSYQLLSLPWLWESEAEYGIPPSCEANLISIGSSQSCEYR